MCIYIHTHNILWYILFIYYLLYIYIYIPPSYMQSVIDQNVIMLHMTVHSFARCYLYSTEIPYCYLLIWKSPFSYVHCLLLLLISLSHNFTAGLILIQFYMSFYCLFFFFSEICYENRFILHLLCIPSIFYVTISIHLGYVEKKMNKPAIKCIADPPCDIPCTQ